MSFDPTGGFANTPLLPEAIAAAKELLGRLPAVPKRDLTRGYFHWAVACYTAQFHDYNGMIVLGEDGKWKMVVTDNPQDNAPGVNDNPVASHTWERNTGAFGISVAGMTGATTTNFGPDPINFHEVHFQCAMMAAFCVKYGVDTMGKVPPPGSNHPSSNDSGNHPGNVNTTGEPNLITHAEAAMYDDYRTERWDEELLVPAPGDYQLSDATRIQCGDALRSVTHQYAVVLRG